VHLPGAGQVHTVLKQAPELMVHGCAGALHTLLSGSGVPAQAPPVQVAPEKHEQSWPQAPQLVTVVRSLSQPLVLGAAMLQSPKPGLQPVYVQAPPTQLAPVEWTVSQAAPHAPQFVMLLSCVSQPLVTSLSQLP
jgi:hypothetical protein